MLIQLKNIQLAYGAPPLLEGLNLTLQEGERVALLGRNGCGKSTLMKLIAEEIQADDGQIERKPNLRVARLIQEVPQNMQGRVFDLVASGLGVQGALISRYHELSLQVAEQPGLMDELSRVQQAIDASDAWRLNQRVEETLSRLKLDGNADFSQLSGGLKRRVLMAQVWVQEPDLLLLDEPTNHLDIKAIAELEESLLQWGGSLLFITHDRAFLQRLATRIVDLDRGQISSWPGDYKSYLDGKAKALADEEAAQRLFDKRLAQEEVWIRQGIKARRTRNEGRVRALKAMREERSQRRNRSGVAKLETQAAQASGKRVAEVENLSYSWDGEPLVKNFSGLIQRGDKVGIIGPNGVGKTTLIKLLLGALQPDSGSVELGSRLEIAHFDQHRSALDLEASVVDNLAGGSSTITINGQSKHVMSYLQDFLFAPERARTPVKVLSGGERNRLLLAKLFSQPANLLVMDEPTNDLDVETLELLEERLISFDGTLLLVSHDRAFIDNVVTSTLVFEGQGKVSEYVGGYADYLRQRPAVVEAKPVPVEKKTKPKPAKLGSRLSQPERKELSALPKKIEKLEAQLESLQAQYMEPDFHAQAPEEIKSLQDEVAEAESALEAAFARWEELEDLSAS